MPSRQGLFVTLEGVEGAGKTSRCRSLVAALRDRGLNVVRTREPGGPAVAEGIRNLLLDPDIPVPPPTELLLYLAGRAANVELVVRPALEAGSCVVCERYSDSTLAYQVGGRGLDEEAIVRAQTIATGGLTPDVTILLDLDPRIGLARLDSEGGGKDRIERESLDFHDRVRRRYLEMARDEDRFLIVDATVPQAEQDAAILEHVMRSINPNTESGD
ncbi:dTMP kinase [Candidatus Fermentibacteria bacterium]|nr:dTMP kinase [Candidatus Fermentibacteria bacterium]